VESYKNGIPLESFPPCPLKDDEMKLKPTVKENKPVPEKVFSFRKEKSPLGNGDRRKNSQNICLHFIQFISLAGFLLLNSRRRNFPIKIESQEIKKSGFHFLSFAPFFLSLSLLSPFSFFFLETLN